MHFLWLCDLNVNNNSHTLRCPGKTNLADYWTKHHPAKHHLHIRREFLTPHIILEMLHLDIQQSHRHVTTAA
eukprot:CCRYP_008713-RB/>CCRYP_008713-RB protein AED:0.46 eAED:0.46 QI:0/-1/0/1/-1/0/1/0/71